MQLENPEREDRVFSITDESFPFTAECVGKKYTCCNWGDVSDMLLNPVSGQSLIQHAKGLIVRIGKRKKHISLESIAYIPFVERFATAYSKATANFVKSHLFPGDYSEQPNIFYGDGQAFDIIRSAIGECELENIRTMKQQARQEQHVRQ